VSKAPKRNLVVKAHGTSRNKYLTLIPILALLIKVVITLNIKQPDGSIVGGWLGADGESYLKGVNGLILQGYFSNEGVLSYWPAGYPILIWILCKISVLYVILLLSIFQSIFYCLACLFFVRSLTNSILQPYLIPIALVLSFNPTLSLSSLVVGYESPVASCILFLVSIILVNIEMKNQQKLRGHVFFFGSIAALATFMQPRYFLTVIVLVIAWAITYDKRRVQIYVLTLTLSITLIAPAILIQRNAISIDKAVISTNLGVTMRLGAGESTTGSYRHTGPEVPCNRPNASQVNTDGELVKCVIQWYFSNPEKAMRLFINKIWYFWSPWSGPFSNGTMARNPWLKVNPLVEIASNSQKGNDLVYKLVGKSISVLWVLANLFLLMIGLHYLHSSKGILRRLAYLSAIPVVTSLLVSAITIGDHRFRVPTMPLSLFLQVMGLIFIRQVWKQFRDKPQLGKLT